MGQILIGLKNFLELINQNWTLITVIIGLGILVFKRIKNYLSLSEQEKIDLALEQIRVTALKLVTEAELSWKIYKKSGTIKRSDVIDKIFKEYPILGKAINQQEILETLDSIIDESLITLREVVEHNSQTVEGL